MQPGELALAIAIGIIDGAVHVHRDLAVVQHTILRQELTINSPHREMLNQQACMRSTADGSHHTQSAAL